jgi:hypothetical protein
MEPTNVNYYEASYICLQELNSISVTVNLVLDYIVDTI